MIKHFGDNNWKDYIPKPVCEDYPEFNELYEKAWELAFNNIKDIPGMPQTPYMDESLCKTQIWIWDSCFMSLFCKYARDVFPGVETMNNFYEVIHGGKKLPEVIPDENEPAWTNAKAGVPFGVEVHIADNPPLFAWAEYENALFDGDAEYIKELLYKKKILQKHYNWIENLKEPVKPDGVANFTCLISKEKGYVWEGGRSGMDNTPRGRDGEHELKERPDNPRMLWIDAICQQAFSAKIIAKMYSIVKDYDNEKKWLEKFNEKKELVNKFYWDSSDKFYYDIDCESNEFIKVASVASFWPMTAQIASEKQAQCLEREILNPKTFGGIVPFPSLSRSDGDYISDGRYWRGGVWLPTAYAALKGLQNYKMFKTAHTASLKLLKHMYTTYKECTPHTIWECYSPEKCEPSTVPNGSGKRVRPNFCGWSALGPVSVYIEFVLGFHTVDAFNRIVEWEKQDSFVKKIGIENLNFGSIKTDITAIGNKCHVKSNEPYVLKVNGVDYHIDKGINEFELKQ